MGVFGLLKTLEAFAARAPEHAICVARELTKIHEETIAGTALSVLQEFAGRKKILGEYVILVRRSEASAK